mmetsp:Transcript_4716/g.10919  ORF Transcript_4716/g.10919 Transcript_4716/m.10919 type:complete len:96 (-) Transcript_4716:614-901(-)
MGVNMAEKLKMTTRAGDSDPVQVGHRLPSSPRALQSQRHSNSNTSTNQSGTFRDRGSIGGHRKGRHKPTPHTQRNTSQLAAGTAGTRVRRAGSRE